MITARRNDVFQSSCQAIAQTRPCPFLFSYVWNHHPGICRLRGLPLMVSSHTGLRLAKGFSPAFGKGGSPCVITQMVQLKVVSAHATGTVSSLICWYVAQHYNPGRSFEVPLFPSSDWTYLSCRVSLFLFLFFTCLKNVSSFEHCSISFSSDSMAFGEVSFMKIVKVLTGFSSLTWQISRSFQLVPWVWPGLICDSYSRGCCASWRTSSRSCEDGFANPQRCSLLQFHLMLNEICLYFSFFNELLLLALCCRCASCASLPNQRRISQSPCCTADALLRCACLNSKLSVTSNRAEESKTA